MTPLVKTLHVCVCGHTCVTWQPFLAPWPEAPHDCVIRKAA